MDYRILDYLHSPEELDDFLREASEAANHKGVSLGYYLDEFILFEDDDE